MRRHKFNPERYEHEFFFSELLLFSPWRDEEELHPENLEQCGRLYLYKRDAIENVKKNLFPHLKDVELGREMVEKFEFDTNIGKELDPEGEMALDPEDMAELLEDYGGLGVEDMENVFEENEVVAPPASFFKALSFYYKSKLSITDEQLWSLQNNGCILTREQFTS